MSRPSERQEKFRIARAFWLGFEEPPLTAASAVATAVASAATSVASAVPVVVPAAVAAAATAATRSRSLRLGLVDAEGTAVQFVPVEFVAGVFGHGRGHGNEAKTTDLAGIAIGGHEAIGHRPVLLEQTPDALFVGVKGQIADVELDLLE